MWCAALTNGLLLVAAAQAPPAAAPAEAPALWTFARVLERVTEQGTGLQEARLRLERSRLGVQDARNAFYPALSATTGVLAGTIEGQSPFQIYYDVRATPILDGYEKFFARRIAEIELQYNQLEERQVRELLVSRARQSYLSVIATARAQAQLAAAVTHAQRVVELAAAEAEPDLAALKRLEASSALQRERMGLRALESRRAEEELRLKTLLGLAPDTPFAVDTDTPPSEVLPSTSDATPAADGPESTRASLNLEAAKQRLRATRFESYPQPSLRLGLHKNGVEFRSGAYVFAGVEIPLFDWGQKKRQRARATIDVAEKERELKRATLERQAELARSDLKRAALEQRSRDLQEGIELAERRLKLQLALYQNGRVSALELARTQLENARDGAEHALNEGAIWIALCQHETLLRLGVASAP